MSIVGKNITKVFGPMKFKALEDINLEIQKGEFVSISGKSGSGKSTLLYIISSLDAPSSGDVFIDGKNINKMSVEEIHRFRNLYIGFIFQFHYLLPEISVLENVLLPARQANLYEEKHKRALELLERLEILEKKDRLPSELSGGQQQRVAIARALIMDPKYIFADEPTGNLDSHNGEIVMNILKEVNKRDGTTIALVTHDADYAAMAEREIFLVDGKVTS